jgi:hypothetical protein
VRPSQVAFARHADRAVEEKAPEKVCGSPSVVGETVCPRAMLYRARKSLPRLRFS